MADMIDRLALSYLVKTKTKCIALSKNVNVNTEKTQDYWRVHLPARERMPPAYGINTGSCALKHARIRENTMKTKLPREILTLVNRKSHSLGVAYAEQTKQQLLNELDCMRSKGATLNDLEKYIVNRPPPIFTA